MNNPDTLDKILKPLHATRCRTNTAWFKGQTEPYPCDCYVIDAKQQLVQWRATTLLEMIGEDDIDIMRGIGGVEYRINKLTSANKLRAELRQQIEQQTKETE